MHGVDHLLGLPVVAHRVAGGLETRLVSAESVTKVVSQTVSSSSISGRRGAVLDEVGEDVEDLRFHPDPLATRWSCTGRGRARTC